MASRREHEEKKKRDTLLKSLMQYVGNPAAGALALGAQRAKQGITKPVPQSGTGRWVAGVECNFSVR
ncbi:hypothetical protein NE562_07750 [Butyricicoccus faecihominis]|uniref:hypothetical protein n=1 Tax=Butyricicoccus faecihominis TaxID=1712515 RepID=UPI002479049E|nr:hypothetical protein [Butyricicoccus faecihominis]MCQ5129552.1 hypothetical protein [Butyricicoccus faecihominis]